LKRTPWLSWRLYFSTIPVDVTVLLLSGDHASTGSNDFLNWTILSIFAHASIAPVTAIALLFTSKFDTWKVDLLALLTLGAVRGVAINIGFEILDLEPKVSSLYKVMNSTISLPLWFIGIAVFIESRRQFQREFESIFLRSVRKEQTSAEMNLDLIQARDEYTIKHLQSVAKDLAREIEVVLDLPASQVNYAKQAHKIQNLISAELKPASTLLWNGSTLSTPKLSIKTLIRISLLEQKLKVASASLFFGPYIFIGLNGSQGTKFAVVETVLATCLNILIFWICEALFNNGILNRKTTNIAIIALSFCIPLITILYILPSSLFWTNSIATTFIYQFFLTTCHTLILLGFNLYKLLGQQRSAVLKSFREIIDDGNFPPISNADLAAVKDIDLARFLHGEVQAGLVAASLLLNRASNSGDVDLARHALRSAANLLKQDYVQVSQSRISSPQARLEKLSSGWRGIAEVKFTLGCIDALKASEINDVIALIDEGVSNAIRHAQASTISVSGEITGVFLNIELISDGSIMTHNTAGLGTKLFTELTTNWEYSRIGEENHLKFTIRIDNK
jgi:signal transduction histidine kinase